jgi:hypothetical protein
VNATPAQVNGTKRPAVPLYEGWQPFPIHKGVMREESPTPEPAPLPVAAAAPAVDPVAEAEAEAIRARTEAETRAAELLAQAEADAIRAQGEAKAEQQRIANERAAMRLAREKAENNAKIAEAQARQKAAERQAEANEKKDEAEQAAVEEEQGKREKSAKSWKVAALGFAIACAVVALPVQMSAFWDPHQKWLLAAVFCGPLIGDLLVEEHALGVEDSQAHYGWLSGDPVLVLTSDSVRHHGSDDGRPALRGVLAAGGAV